MFHLLLIIASFFSQYIFHVVLLLNPWADSLVISESEPFIMEWLHAITCNIIGIVPSSRHLVEKCLHKPTFILLPAFCSHCFILILRNILFACICWVHYDMKYFHTITITFVFDDYPSWSLCFTKVWLYYV